MNRADRLRLVATCVAPVAVLSLLRNENLIVTVFAIAVVTVLLTTIVFWDGPLERRMGIVGATVLSLTFVVAAMWLHVHG